MSPRTNVERRRAATARESPARGAILASILLLAFGTCGYMWVEGWDVWQSAFFTVITLSTVGYGDYGLSDGGERFTTLLILVGIGVVTYSASQIAPLLFNQNIAREWAMKREIARLKNHFIVCGLGRVGVEVCRCLANENVPFVVVDPNADRVAEAAALGYLAIAGDAASDEVLSAVGVERARAVACVTSSDTENIVITLSARQLNPDAFIISRAEHASTARKAERAGATRVLSPIRAGGESIAQSLINPHLADLLRQASASDQGIELGEIVIQPECPLAGRTVSACGQSHPGVVFVAIKQKDAGLRFRPAADEHLTGGDVLIVAGDVLAVGRMQDAAKSTARRAA